MNTDERPRLGTWAAALIFTGAAVSFSAAGGADTRIVGHCSGIGLPLQGGQ